MTGACSHCGTVGPLQRHHPTGRDHGTPYHPELVDPICQRCHVAEHRVWQATGIDHMTDPEVLVLRLAMWLGRRTAVLSADGCHVMAGDLASPLWLSVLKLCEALGIEPCVPELVVHESVNLRAEKYQEAASSFSKAAREISRFFDAPGVYVPDTAEIAARWKHEILEKFTVIAPLGEDAAEALKREALRLPPARDGRGARDSLIWLTALRRLKSGENVFFVSANTSDFGGKAKDSLHPVLETESSGMAASLNYCVGLDAFIDLFATKHDGPSVDGDEVASAIKEEILLAAFEVLSTGTGGPSVEEVSTAFVKVTSAKTRRSYVIAEEGLALVDGACELQNAEGQGEHAPTNLTFTFRAWVDFDLGSGTPLSGEVVNISRD